MGMGTRRGGRPDTTTPVVLLQGVPDPFHHGMLAAARSLGRFGAPVFTISSQPHAPVERSRYVVGSAALDLRSAAPERVMDALGTLLGPHGRAVAVPVDDVAALCVEEAPVLRERLLLPDRPSGLLRQLMDKRALAGLVCPLGVPAPRACPVPSDEELFRCAAQLGLPVVLKGADPLALRVSPEAKSVTVAHSLAALSAAYRSLDPGARATALLQEHIGGEDAADWIFNGCFGRSGGCLFQGTGLKLRQWPAGTGAATLGVSAPNATVAQLSRRLVAAVGYQGVVDIDFRFDPKDGQYKLLDVNPRVGASFRLFVSDSGLDVLRTHYLDLTGQAAPPEVARSGRKWIVEQRDLRAGARLLGSGGLNAGGWARSLAGVEETAWFDARDPGPLAGLASHYASRWARQRPWKRRRERSGHSGSTG